MRRPIGVMLLAAGAGLLALYQLYQMLIYMGIVNFPVDNPVLGNMSFDDPQWGAALWSLLIAATWAWGCWRF